MDVNLSFSTKLSKVKEPNFSTKLYYSDYGYINVKDQDLEKEDFMVPFENRKSSFQGFIHRDNLKQYIEIKLKTFYGKRLSYPIKVSINDLIMDLPTKLIIAEQEYIEKNLQDDNNLGPEDHWIYNAQYRLISTSAHKIKELHPLKTFAEEDIYHMQTLMLLPQKDIYFSEQQMGANVFLEGNSTAYKMGSDDPQMILADQGFKTGRNYCEFIFETEPAERSIVIGICLTRSEFYFNFSDPKGFWGFIPSECKKIGYNEKGVLEKKEYGSVCKIGDHVGILMEFTVKGMNLTIFVNKVNLGIAFSNLPLQTYYPCAILGFDSSKIHMQHQSYFPDL